MPSIYVGSALMELVEDERNRIARERRKKTGKDEVYVSESEALRSLLDDGVQSKLDEKRD